MFFKKRKEQKLQRVAQARRDTIDALHAQVDEALGTIDPALRILNLEAVRRDALAQLRKEEQEIYKKADKAGLKVYGAGSGAAIAGTVAAAIPTAGLSMLFFPAALGGTIYATNKRTNVVEDKLFDEMKDYRQQIVDVQLRILSLEEAIIDEKVEVIAKSKYAEDIFAVKHVSEIFADAAARRLTAPPPAPVEKKPAAPRKPQEKPNYDLFTKFRK